MKNHCVFAPFALAIAAATAASAGAQEVLTGDTRLACEATLCLATRHPSGRVLAVALALFQYP
jgi:hypothetical protein